MEASSDSDGSVITIRSDRYSQIVLTTCAQVVDGDRMGCALSMLLMLKIG